MTDKIGSVGILYLRLGNNDFSSGQTSFLAALADNTIGIYTMCVR
jgi:hypothetical protein